MHRDFVLKFTVFVAVSLGATFLLWYGIQSAMQEITANLNSSVDEQIRNVNHSTAAKTNIAQAGKKSTNTSDKFIK